MKEITQIILGTKVKDKVTGFEGIATARVKYLNGCIQYCVDPKVDKEGKMSKCHYIDFDQLEIIKISDAKDERAKEKGPGGVMPNVPE